MGNGRFRRRATTLTIVASLFSFGFVGLSSAQVSATTVPKSIPLQRGNLKFHISWEGTSGGAPVTGTVGKYRVKATITQPNPDAAVFVVKGTIDGLNVHATIDEGFGADGVTFTERGAIGNKAFVSTGSLGLTSTESYELIFTGRLGTTKLTGKIPLAGSSPDSASGYIKVL